VKQKASKETEKSAKERGDVLCHGVRKEEEEEGEGEEWQIRVVSGVCTAEGWKGGRGAACFGPALGGSYWGELLLRRLRWVVRGAGLKVDRPLPTRP
jgi:hypothetical protein